MGGIKMKHGYTATIAILAAVFLGVFGLLSPTPASAQVWQIQSCADCHNDGAGGEAPADAIAGVRNNPTGAVAGSHGAHFTSGAAVTPVACSDCHIEPTRTPPAYDHGDGNIDMDLGITYSRGGTVPQSATVQPADLGTCSTAACHDDGLGNQLASPQWGSDLANCTQCHAEAPSTGSHTAHLNDGAVCADCHDGAVQGTTYPSEHLDGNVDVFDATPGDLGYPVDAAKGTASWSGCNNASCHEDGRNNLVMSPTWGSTPAQCSECHAVQPATGSHTAHLNTTVTSVACGDCHSGAVEGSNAGTAHRDNDIDTVASLGYTQNKAKGSAFESCATASCHDDGMGTVVATPVWGTASACNECHSDAPATGSHTAHLNDGASCSDCHDNADPATETAPGQHYDGNVDVYATTAGDLGYPQDAAKGSASWASCSAASCHEDGRNNLVMSPTWGSTPAQCSECHAVQPATGSHTAHLNTTVTSVACGDCHSGAVEGSNAGTAHRDNDIDTVASLGYTQNKAKGSAFESCATASCHDDGMGTVVATPVWGTASACSECHESSPTTGSHSAHFNSTVVSGVNVPVCADCHNSAVEASDPGVSHYDGNVDVYDAAPGDLGYPTSNPKGDAYASCSTADCHSDGLGNHSTVTWGTTSTGCDFCHGAPPTATNPSHPNDSDCSKCHTQVAAGDTSFTDPSTHIDGTVDKPTGLGCNTCHGYWPTGPDPADGLSPINIEGKGAHLVHISEIMDRTGATLNASSDTYDPTGAGISAGVSTVCGTCHDLSSGNHDSGGGTGTVNMIGTIENYRFAPGTANDPVYNGTPGVGSATTPKTCSNISCHFNETPVWAQPQ